MKYLIWTVALTATVASTALASGGSSVAGPGAPSFEYGCYELNYIFDNSPTAKAPFTVSAVRSWPDYSLSLAVIDPANQTVDSAAAVKRMPGTIGAPIIYLSGKYRLEIYSTTTPIKERGHLYSYSRLYVNGLPDREMKCESFTN